MEPNTKEIQPEEVSVMVPIPPRVESKTKKIFMIGLVVILPFLFGFSASAEEISEGSLYPSSQEVKIEQINSMNIEARINSDGQVDVMETINYDFGNEYKHGIYRTIPLGFKAQGQPGHTEIKVISVTDELGRPYNYDITSQDPINVKIGDADEAITGEHIYKISYTLDKSIGYYDNFDEWYWNLTGNAWEIPIKNVTATIILPATINQADFKLKDYCGSKNNIKSCGAFSLKDNQTVSYTLNQDKVLNSTEGVTIAVGFPKGLIPAPTKLDLFWANFMRFWFIPLPFLLALWWFRKRFSYMWEHYKYFKRNTIIAEYDASDFNPLEVALLVNKYVEEKDLSAIIVHLAILGYIKIEEKDGEFCFKKIKEPPTDLTQSEKLIFEAVEDICESNFGLKESKKFLKSLDQAGSRLIARDYILAGKLKFKNTIRDTSGIGIFLPLFFAINPGAFIWFFGGIWAGFAFSGACILIAIGNIFTKNISKYPTLKGIEAERKLLGLKLYLKVAEKNRINFANAPAKTPELFEKLLPYAMVFGLEKKWAKEFENIYTINPAWYAGGAMTAFSTMAFVSSLNSIQSSTTSAIASSVPSSSSSWSSSSGGSSGGGSSGGGGGGGGGGSW